MSMERLVNHIQEGGPVAELLHKATSGTPSTGDVANVEAMRDTVYPFPWGFQLELTQMIYRDFGIGWSSHHHTAECIEFLAAGPGSDTIPRFFENHEVFDLLANALNS